MGNKFTRFVVTDIQFRIRLILLGILVVVIILGATYMRYQSRRLKEVKLQEMLVTQIAQMQNIVSSRAKPKVEQAVTKDYFLQGLTEQDGVYVALINDNIYSEGDTVGDYVIAKIGVNAVVLTHKKTNAEKVLMLYSIAQVGLKNY